MDPVAFHARVLAHADADGRLTCPPDVPWPGIFPYETADLVAVPVAPLVLPEPPRDGEEAADCRCTGGVPAHALWTGERWYLTPVTDSGLPAVMLHPRRHADWTELLPPVEETVAREVWDAAVTAVTTAVGGTP